MSSCVQSTHVDGETLFLEGTFPTNEEEAEADVSRLLNEFHDRSTHVHDLLSELKENLAPTTTSFPTSKQQQQQQQATKMGFKPKLTIETQSSVPQPVLFPFTPQEQGKRVPSPYNSPTTTSTTSTKMWTFTSTSQSPLPFSPFKDAATPQVKTPQTIKNTKLLPLPVEEYGTKNSIEEQLADAMQKMKMQLSQFEQDTLATQAKRKLSYEKT